MKTKKAKNDRRLQNGMNRRYAQFRQRQEYRKRHVLTLTHTQNHALDAVSEELQNLKETLK